MKVDREVVQLRALVDAIVVIVAIADLYAPNCGGALRSQEMDSDRPLFKHCPVLADTERVVFLGRCGVPKCARLVNWPASRSSCEREEQND